MTDAPNDEGDARNEAPANLHDATFKVVFEDPACAAVVLREALPPALVGLIDWVNLEAGKTVVTGGDLREGSRDLLFVTKLRARTRGQSPSRWASSSSSSTPASRALASASS